jgi:uncharacterized membrane protein
MNQAIENYIPRSMYPQVRKQAVRVWIAASSVVLVWVGLIVLAPIAKAGGYAAISSPIYGLFHYICHQMPARSLHVEGEQFAVCSRCFGVYFGLLLGFVVYPLWRRIDDIEPLPRFWLFLSMIPIGVDWSLGVFDIWANTHLSRFVTGSILGFACAVFLIPGLVEITRNLTGRRRDNKSVGEQVQASSAEVSRQETVQ